MILTGPDFTTGAFKRPGGVGFADDMVIMALQCGTQWGRALALLPRRPLYNGYDATSSRARAPRRTEWRRWRASSRRAACCSTCRA